MQYSLDNHIIRTKCNKKSNIPPECSPALSYWGILYSHGYSIIKQGSKSVHKRSLAANSQANNSQMTFQNTILPYPYPQRSNPVTPVFMIHMFISPLTAASWPGHVRQGCIYNGRHRSETSSSRHTVPGRPTYLRSFSIRSTCVMIIRRQQ